MHLFNPLFNLAIAIGLYFALNYLEQMHILCYLLFARITHNNWSQAVKQARLDHGLTQEELAERVGVDVRTIQRWEAGTQKPHLSTQSLFFRALKENYLKENYKVYVSLIKIFEK